MIHSTTDHELYKGHLFNKQAKQTKSDKSDERKGARKGEDKYMEHERKSKRDERKGEMEYGKKKEKIARTKADYKEAVKTSRPGEGKRFKALSGSIAAQYEAKGKSPDEAKKIAGAIAAKAGRAKYGAKKMAKWSKK